MSSITELQSFSSVPKLEVNGSNWIIFAIRLKWALQDKKVYTHLDGTSAKPENAADISAWEEDESKARHLLAQKLHDSTLTKLLHLDTVAKMWSALTTEFTVKSSHVVAAMRTAFDRVTSQVRR